MISLFLDSGAFSAWTRGSEVDIDDYIAYIKRNQKYVAYYANLDVIGDGEASFQNWRYMREQGLEPVPIYHPPTDVKYLEAYLKDCDFLAIGGISATSKRDRLLSLDRLWRDYLTDDKGLPVVKVHGFGLGSLDVLVRYPWYSVDNTTWLQQAIYGRILVPYTRGGIYVYDRTPIMVSVSGRSPTKAVVEGPHITSLTEVDRKVVFDYFESKGYTLGLSEFKVVDPEYVLGENEVWTGSVLRDDRKEVEVRVEDGLCNNYEHRLEICVKFFMDYAESVPEWPWAFKGVRSLGVQK